MTAVPAPDAVIDALATRFPTAVEELVALARVPSVSAPGFPADTLRRSADAVAELRQYMYDTDVDESTP